MKILWLCSMMLPQFAPLYNATPSPMGGWLTGLYSDLSKEVSIDVCFPYRKEIAYTQKDFGENTLYAFGEADDCSETFVEILQDSKPDIIHIWGTEEKMTLNMVNASYECGMQDKVVINIQGLVSIISKYHYNCFLPTRVSEAMSFVEYKHKIAIKHKRNDMALRGQFEIEALKKVKYVIGRTDWDEACVTQINPSVTYLKCNETLRKSFYENEWDINTCEKHSIFVSQSNYPLKGFHLMLEAMPLILKRYPNAKLYTTGNKPKAPKTIKEKYAREEYPSYIAELIRDNNLEENVVFLGRLNEEEMCNQYLKSNVFVSPSSIENSSNSIGEAMLLGMPVVASDVGGVKNFMNHEKEGFLYQADAPYMLAYYVSKVFEDEDRAVEIGKVAHQRAMKSYNKEFNLKRMVEIYQLITEGK